MDRLKSYIYKADNWACALGNLCIVINMSVVVFNIIMRNVFHWSLAGITDYAGFISCLIVVFCIGYTESKNGNPRVDFIMEHMPKPVQRGVFLLVTVLDAVVGGVLAVSFFSYAASSAAAGTTSMNAKLPYAPFLVVCGIGMTLFALTVLANAATKIKGWKGET